MKEQPEDKKDFELVQVPASFTTAVQTPNGEVLNMEQALVAILNILKDIDKRI